MVGVLAPTRCLQRGFQLLQSFGRPIDVGAEAVKNVPPTSDEGALAPRSPRMIGPPRCPFDDR